MKPVKNQAGVIIIETILLLIVVAVLVVVIGKVKSKRSTTSAPVATTPTATLKSDSDLQSADVQLSQENLDVPTEDETKLDSELANF